MIDFCSAQAARYACEHWHYSGTMPIGKTVKVGLWEDETYRGAVVFSSGVGNLQALGFAYDLPREATCELARVALRSHTMPVSQLVSGSLRRLREVNPGLELVISYADPEHGHLGRIYQAMNWAYLGLSASLWEKYLGGKWRHNRTVQGASNDNPFAKTEFDHGLRDRPYTPDEIARAPIRYKPRKFRYGYAFDKRLRRRLRANGEPYPTYNDLAEQVSEARRHPSGVEG